MRITDTTYILSGTIPWPCASSGCNTTLYEEFGGGNTLASSNDRTLVKDVLGTEIATIPSGTNGSYWLSMRYYDYLNGPNFTGSSVTGSGAWGVHNLYNPVSGYESSSKKSIRPIVTLKAGLTYTSGDGSQASPWVVEMPE